MAIKKYVLKGKAPFWKISIFIFLTTVLFFLGASVWKIKNEGFFNALSLPANYGEEVSKLSNLRTSKASFLVEVGSNQINSLEFNWEMELVKAALEADGLVDKSSIGMGESLKKALQKELLAMLIERKILYSSIQFGEEFSMDDPKRYTGCVDQWQKLEKGPLSSSFSANEAKYVKSSLCERSLLQQYIKEHIDDKIVVTSQEIADFFKENSALFNTPEKVEIRHVLMADESTALKVRSAITPKNFAEMAQKYSIAPEGVRGGLLPPFSRGSMVPVFSRAFSLKPSEISVVARSDYGYHIMMLEKRTPQGRKKLDEVSREISHILFSRKRSAEYQRWIEGALAKLPIGSARYIW
jgi:hypothetical protein